MRAMELLIEYRRLRAKIARLRSQMEELKEQAESLSAWTDGDRVQSSHDPDKIGRVIAKLSDMEDERNDLILEAADRMNEIEAVISELKNPDYALVLQYYYIRGLTFEQTAMLMCCTSRWAMSLRDRAVKAMDERMRNDSEFLGRTI